MPKRLKKAKKVIVAGCDLHKEPRTNVHSTEDFVQFPQQEYLGVRGLGHPSPVPGGSCRGFAIGRHPSLPGGSCAGIRRHRALRVGG